MISFFLFSDFDGAARLERSSSILQIDNSGVSKYVTFQLESTSRDIFKFLCCSNCCSFSWSFWVSNLNIMHGIHHILLLSSKIIIRVFNLLKKWTCAMEMAQNFVQERILELLGNRNVQIEKAGPRLCAYVDISSPTYRMRQQYGIKQKAMMHTRSFGDIDYKFCINTQKKENPTHLDNFSNLIFSKN